MEIDNQIHPKMLFHVGVSTQQLVWWSALVE
jgi:hypothetical protein